MTRRIAAVAIVLASGLACSTTAHRGGPETPARGSTAAHSSPPRPTRAFVPSQPGERVPASTVSLPARAGAGTTVLLRAPVGSQVDAFGGSHRVPASGQLALTVPDDVEGRVPVRVQRPAGPALVLRLHVTPPVP